MVTYEGNLAEVSFPDENIVSWSLSEEHLQIELTGVFIEKPISGICEMQLANWSNIKVNRFNNKSNQHATIDSDYEPLKDICEFVATPQKIVLKGFGANQGEWLEYTFTNPSVEIRYSAP